jgi:hypothetical protein
MPNPFTEDALIEQPAIRLFKDVLGWQARGLSLSGAGIGELTFNRRAARWRWL